MYVCACMCGWVNVCVCACMCGWVNVCGCACMCGWVKCVWLRVYVWVG